MAETRKDKRAPVSLKVRFKSATVDEFIEQYSRDVSRGGIFIKSGQPMSIGTLLKFQFQLKDESPLIKGVGRVVWIRTEDDATAENPSGMGIKFIKMDNDSRATVDRVVTTHEGEPGTFEQGDTSGGESSGQDEPGFFPNLPPAKLPAPEDQTAVRHAAQFLASALSGAGTDEEATREAEQRAEEARRRSAQIEAQRAAEAEKAKQEQLKQAKTTKGTLPSMIIDPSLSEAGAAVQVPQAAVETRPAAPSPRAPAASPRASQQDKAKPPPASDADEEPVDEDTSVTDRSALTGQKPSISSAPSSLPPPAKKSNLVPAMVVTAAVMLAAFFALRSDDSQRTELTASQPASEVVYKAPKPSVTPIVSPGAAQPQPAKVEEAQPKVAEDAGRAPSPAAEPAPQPAVNAPVVEPLVKPVERVAVVVTTLPEGAEISVDGVVRGKSPISIELAKGVEAKITAKATGRVTLERTVTPKAASNPVRLTLLPVPYIVHVESNPPGATVLVGGKKGVTPVDLTLNAAPKGMLGVTARLFGHQLAQTTISRDGFVEEGETMRTNVTIDLTPLPTPVKPAKPVPPIPKPAPAGTTTVKPAPEKAPAPTVAPTDKAAPEATAPLEKAAPAPSPAAKPAPAPAKPAPTTKPAPAPGEPIPDNPFG
jgi:uncharacterized protein (TIGR02266 family)